MIRLRIYCFVVAMLAVQLAVTHSFSQEEMRVVDNSVFDRPVRTSALFAHDIHNEEAELEDCNVCHHLYEDGKLVEDESSEDQACSECHLENVAGDNPSLRRAYHLNCKGCHLQKGAGPIMCAQCHQEGASSDTLQDKE
jgi:hypothetical protein